MRRFFGLMMAVFSLVVVAGSMPLTAASFNCRPYFRSGKCPEVVICRDSFLSSQDEYMASLYFMLRRRLAGGLRKKFREYQRSWLAKRNSCGCDRYCLSNAYRNQIEGLTRTRDGM